jgi:hypothetical protein
MTENGNTVYIIGAGFSAGLGYPVTSNLLIEVWSRLSRIYQKRLTKVIAFHHPNFNSERATSFPYIETLLTQISVNLEMFKSSRITEGTFTKADLLDVRAELLTQVARWFHDLYPPASEIAWLANVAERMRDDNATVISFNWDLVLDQKLFDEVSAANYGLAPKQSGPTLLKPHGSLNWYEADQINKISPEKRIELQAETVDYPAVEAFLLPRHIISKAGRRYTPLIVPPTYIKDFSRPISVKLWRKCTAALSSAKRIYVLGYSLPEADMQAQFIFRCGFHNQRDGMIESGGRRSIASGPAQVTVVNPDSAAARRLESVVGKDSQFEWQPLKIEEWAKRL